LEDIERAVQERAKDISLEMRGGEGTDKLRLLIGDEVARWSLDHRRGLRPFDLAEPELVAERAFRNLAGYGPLGPLLEDDDVWEIMINAPDPTLELSSDPRGRAATRPRPRRRRRYAAHCSRG
jgi:pilus assembly protein CpaF